ncbi:MAG: ABC transporter ATP-binding protein [Butyrivibrio sp.]|nr:ABC transporter ATP-binding protein [Butyrivibrio sp.]
MIEALNVEKSFDKVKAVNGVTLKIQDGEVFGLLGTNGAGKSTLLRMIAGILIPEHGTVCVDQMPVYDNPKIKKNIFFISDEPYFFPNSTAQDMMTYYSNVYAGFNIDRFTKLCKGFELDTTRKVADYSKGMKKQLAILIGICAETRYLLCDETFDGLDPVVRQGIKSLIAGDIADRTLTPVIASHNLRELEDICDHVGLLHKGGVLLSESIESMKLNLQKVQCVFASEEDMKQVQEHLDVMVHDVRGRLHTYTVRGERSQIEKTFRSVNTVFFEILALSLEEIFISETEVVGYDVRKFILS